MTGRNEEDRSAETEQTRHRPPLDEILLAVMRAAHDTTQPSYVSRHASIVLAHDDIQFDV